MMNLLNRRDDTVILKRQYWGYVSTYIFSYLSGAVSALVDGWFTSKFLSAEDIAAFGLCSLYFTILALLGSMLSYGLQCACTRHLSNGDSTRSNRVFSLVLELAVGIALVLMAYAALFPAQLCTFLGAHGDSASLSAGIMAYNRGFLLGVPGMLATTILPVVITICGGRQYAALAVLVQTISDFVLNYAALRIFNAGLTGLAWATTGSLYLSVAVMVFFLCRKQRMFRFQLTIPNLPLLAEITSGGLPRFLRKLASILSTLVINHTILIFGSQYMAALFIVTKIGDFFLSITVGISSTIFLMSQILFQEENIRELKWLARYTLLWGTVLGMGTTLLLNAAGGWLLRIFGADAQVSGLALAGLRLYSLSFLFATTAESIYLYLQASGRLTAANTFASLSKLMTCLAFPMSLAFGVNGVWLSFTLAEVSLIVLFVIYRLLCAAREHNTIGNSLLLVSNEMEQTQRSSMEWTVSTMEDAIGISRKIDKYLTSLGIARRKVFFSSLAIEEMAVIFAEKAALDGKEHHCMIFLLHRGDEILIRFRDDCQVFNICQQYETLHDCDDPAAHIGIRLLFGIAKQLDYSSIMNLNMVVLRV